MLSDEERWWLLKVRYLPLHVTAQRLIAAYLAALKDAQKKARQHAGQGAEPDEDLKGPCSAR